MINLVLHVRYYMFGVGEHDNNAFGYSKAGLFLLAFACGEPRTSEHAD